MLIDAEVKADELQRFRLETALVESFTRINIHTVADQLDLLDLSVAYEISLDCFH